MSAQICKPNSAQTDTISCTDQCTLTGCRMCQDDPGKGEIDGQVFDAIYSNEPVPAARVTLFLRGIQVDQTFTGPNGEFSFNTLNTRPECSTYRIIVDEYKDNPCTANGKNKPNCAGQLWNNPDVHLGALGGYWAYESNTFNTNTFTTDGVGEKDGKIYLVPKVGPNETLVVLTWNGDVSARPPNLQAIIPAPIRFWYCAANGYNPTNPPTDCNSIAYFSSPTYAVCSDPLPDQNGQCPATAQKRYSCAPPPFNGQSCVWEIYPGDDSLQDVYTEDSLPFGNIHCTDDHSQRIKNCVGDLSHSHVATLRYKRGDYAVTGQYTVHVDVPAGDPPSATYWKNINATIRVVTQNNLYVLPVSQAPLSPVCQQHVSFDGGGQDLGSYWLVFQQDARSGNMTVQNQLDCAGDVIPNADAP